MRMPRFDKPDARKSDRKGPEVKLPQIKLPQEVHLPDMTLPRVSMGEIRRQDVQLPDMTLPRVSMGEIRRQDVQLPDVTLPRLRMGDVDFKDVRLRGPRLGGLKTLIRLVVMSLFGMAIYKEMSQPEAQRTWHGDVFGVPYDFRPPTSQRLRDAWWNEHAGLFTASPWGVGWTINFRRAMDMAAQTKDSRLPGMAGSPARSDR
jgi:hypothetical protein